MTIQDQYLSTVRQATETWTGVAEALTDNVQKAFAQAAGPFEHIDPNAAIDQVFDFWEKTLEAQRGVVKQFAGVTVAAAEQVRSQAESLGTAVREQTESASQTVREYAEATQDAAQEQAAKKYADLTKAELQDDLAKRDLPKTGTVDELRERLIEDDTK
jgi:hypothetical protein